MIDEFPYYGLSWFFYLLTTFAFLLVSMWKTRKWSNTIRIPLLSFFAAMALTPGLTLSGEGWYSPAAIIMIFELDKKGLSGIWHSALSIIGVWIMLMTATFITRWQLAKKAKKPNNKSNKSNEEKEPELIEPN